MPTIINPYRPDTQLGETIARVGQELFGGNNVAAAVRREQLMALQRENAETRNLMGAVTGTGDIDWGVAGPAMIGAGYNPAHFNEFARGRAAALHGASDPRTQAAQIGAGGAFSSTADAFGAAQATERRGQDIASGDRRYGVDVGAATDRRGQDLTMDRHRYEFDNKPLEAMRDGQPVYVPQGGAFQDGVSPIVKEDSSPAAKYDAHYQLYLRANPGDTEGADRWALQQSASRSGGMSISTGPDGEMSIEMGGVPGLERSVRGREQTSMIANNRLKGLMDVAYGLTEDPTLFGATGVARDYAQNAVQLLNNITQMTGRTSAQEYIDEVRAEVRQSGLAMPELFDPNVSAVETVWGLLTYSAAAALAGQSGRDVSDKDIKQMRGIVGDPRSFFSSAESMKAKLDTVNQLVGVNEETGRAALSGQPLPQRGTPQAAAGPAVGTIEDGYEFIGGDPSSPQSWRQVQ